jgi:ATP-binding cassette, subfamily F, member 3
MNHLHININTYERDGDIIIGDIHTIINQTDRLALIGPNGVGKSTLMRIISGQIHEYEGSIENIGAMTLGYLEQIHFMDESVTIRDELRDGFAEIRELERVIATEEAKMAETGEFDAYTEAIERYKMIWGYTYENEVERVARGIGIFDLLEKPLSNVSGGERTKIALAKILLSKPDFLLLDEPTNFIDLVSVEWLEHYLEHTWKWGYLIVSHDREFLDRTCSTTIEVLGPYGINTYHGDYSYSVEERKKSKQIQDKRYEEQQIHIESEKKLINRFRAGSRAGFAKSRERQLDKIDMINKPENPIGVNFVFSYDKHSPETLIKIEDVFIGRHEPLFYIRTAILSRWDRVWIVWENWVGKSTLIKTILGQMKPLEWYLSVHENARILYFSQLHETLNTSLSIYDNFTHHGLPYSHERVGSIISTYGFEFADYTKIVGNLSGGERSRLLFAILSQNTLAWKHVFQYLDTLSSRGTWARDPENSNESSSAGSPYARGWQELQEWQKPTESSSISNLLIFDEPTNHLDADTRESLERAIREYPGTILFISHDRYFVNKLAERLWIIEDGELIISYGNYEDYRYKRERGIDLDMSLFNVDGEMDIVLEEKLGVVEARRIKEKFARRKLKK